jgi:hypothetical protein
MKIDFETLELGRPILRMEPETKRDYEFLRNLVKLKLPERDLTITEFVKLDMTNFFAQTHIARIENMDSPEATAGQTAESHDNAPGSENSAQGGDTTPAQG